MELCSSVAATRARPVLIDHFDRFDSRRHDLAGTDLESQFLSHLDRVVAVKTRVGRLWETPASLDQEPELKRCHDDQLVARASSRHEQFGIRGEADGMDYILATRSAAGGIPRCSAYQFIEHRGASRQ